MIRSIYLVRATYLSCFTQLAGLFAFWLNVELAVDLLLDTRLARIRGSWLKQGTPIVQFETTFASACVWMSFEIEDFLLLNVLLVDVTLICSSTSQLVGRFIISVDDNRLIRQEVPGLLIRPIISHSITK